VKLLERAGVTPEKICEWEKVISHQSLLPFFSLGFSEQSSFSTGFCVFLFQVSTKVKTCQREATHEITIPFLLSFNASFLLLISEKNSPFKLPQDYKNFMMLSEGVLVKWSVDFKGSTSKLKTNSGKPLFFQLKKKKSCIYTSFLLLNKEFQLSTSCFYALGKVVPLGCIHLNALNALKPLDDDDLEEFRKNVNEVNVNKTCFPLFFLFFAAFFP
jgi:hypothetical protein